MEVLRISLHQDLLQVPHICQKEEECPKLLDATLHITQEQLPAACKAQHSAQSGWHWHNVDSCTSTQ
jgi:hypothetical protein